MDEQKLEELVDETSDFVDEQNLPEGDNERWNVDDIFDDNGITAPLDLLEDDGIFQI